MLPAAAAGGAVAEVPGAVGGSPGKAGDIPGAATAGGVAPGRGAGTGARAWSGGRSAAMSPWQAASNIVTRARSVACAGFMNDLR
jgi:hypothetical protein